MAKKSRTPPPPRRVQAPKQRHAPRKGIDPARQRAILYGLAASGLVGLVVVLIVVLAGGKSGPAGNPSAIAATLRAAGCTMTTSKATVAGRHMSSESQKVTYATFPPVSGLHHPTAAILGDYTQPVDPRRAVHNEEHGSIVIWLGPKVSEAERQKVTDFYNESPNAMLVTPIEDKAEFVAYPKHPPAGSTIFLTAWTVEIKDGKLVNGKNIIAACPRFDEKAFTAFRDEFRGKGPERFPVDSLTPGS